MIQSENFEFPESISDLNVLVIGAGLMGHSIAGVFSAAGASVTVHDVDPRALEAVPEKLGKQLVSAGADPAANRVRLAATLEAVAPGIHLVIEAVAEILDVKQELFARLGTLLPHTVLATNTSVFKIGEVARHTSHPERVLGTHWWNPPHLIPLVEVVHGDSTNPAVADSVAQLLGRVGKVPVHVRKDTPEFIGNRLQHAMWREALSLVEAGVCDAETIDLVVPNSFGLRLPVMGPMENADYVGLDLTAAVHNYLFPTLNNDSKASPVVTALIEAGHLGAKTGSGLLQWDSNARAAAAERLEQHLLKPVSGPN
jgi:3-hydroxybutyryl-CoA dehydrogenase